MNFIRLFTTFSGRIPRSSYWLGFVAVILVFMTINHRSERVPENTAQVLATN